MNDTAPVLFLTIVSLGLVASCATVPVKPFFYTIFIFRHAALA